MSHTDLIYNPEISVSLSASAGSGKTFALVARLVRLLAEGADPREILVVTFTNKAAKEMRDRVMEYVYGVSFFNGISAGFRDKIRYLLDEIGVPDIEFISEQFREKVLPNISGDSPSIRTFDSFFYHLLNLFSFEAGLPYRFDIMSSTERDIVFEESLNLLAEEILSNDALKRGIFSLFRTLRTYDPLFFMRKNLLPLMEIRSEIDFRWSVGAIHECEKRLIEEKKKLCGFLKNHRELINKNSLRKIDKFCDDDAHAILDTAKDLTDMTSYSKLPAKELADRWWSFKNAAAELVELKNRASVNILVRLLGMLVRKYDAVVRSRATVSFSDLKYLVFKLFFDKGLAGDKDYLYFRLDSRIKHLLVDEFQDTDVVQWEVMRPIVEEITSGISTKDESGSFFYVGDPKQAIYRFRGSQSSLFTRPVTDFPGKIVISRLKYNYRSGKTIVDFINGVFSSPVFRKTGFEYEPSTAVNESQGYVLVEEEEKFSDFSVLGEKLRATISKLRGGGFSYEDIAVLTRNNNEVEQVTDLLSAKGIPFYTTTSAMLSTTWEAEVVINTLKRLKYGDEIYREVLLSYVDGVDEVLNALARKINVKDNLSIVVDIIRMFGLDKYDASEDTIYSIVDAAYVSCASSVDFSTFVDAMENALKSTKKPSGGSGVNVMTIHQSKGLEFECVILPFISYGVNKRGDFITVRDKTTSRLMDLVKFPTALDRFYSRSLNKYYEDEVSLRLLDEVNLLYVGMTRAKSVLCVFGYADKDNMFSMVKSAIGLNGCFEMGEIGSSNMGATSGRYSGEQFISGRVLRNPPEDNSISDDRRLKERIIGEAFHYGMEIIPDFSLGHVPYVMERVWWKFFRYLKERDISMLERMFKLVLADDRFLNMVEGNVKREKSFVYNGQIMRVDLIVDRGDFVLIVDYKTGVPKPQDDVQIRTYMDVVSRVYRKATRGFLVYVDDNVSIKEVV